MTCESELTAADLLYLFCTCTAAFHRLSPIEPIDFKPGLASARDRLRRAMKAGVRIGAGSDMYLVLPGRTRGQASTNMFSSYAEAGMPPIEIIRAATINNAELLNRSSDVGALEAGKFADVIAVSDDPLKDPTVLRGYPSS